MIDIFPESVSLETCGATWNEATRIALSRVEGKWIEERGLDARDPRRPRPDFEFVQQWLPYYLAVYFDFHDAPQGASAVVELLRARLAK